MRTAYILSAVVTSGYLLACSNGAAASIPEEYVDLSTGSGAPSGSSSSSSSSAPPSSPAPSAPSTPDASTPAAPNFKGNYNFIAPTRVADSRIALGIDAKVLPGQVKRLPVGDLLVPAVDRAGLMLQVAVTETAGPGFITVYACDDGKPNTSSLNFDAASTISNAVLVGKGKDVCIETSAAAHVIVDAAGVLAPGGDSFFAVTPFRLHDSRAAVKLVANTEIEISVAGVESIPANASGAALNVTATDAEQDGFLRVYPCGQPSNGTSSLNFRTNAALAGMVFSKVDARGKICVTSSVNTHVVIDASGGFLKNNLMIQGLKPARAFDSRDAAGPKIDGPVSIPVLGKFGIPVAATGTLINLAVTAPDGPGFATVYECGKPVPTTSNLNFAAGQTIANMAVAIPSVAGELCITTNVATHVIVDVLGYVSL